MDVKINGGAIRENRDDMGAIYWIGEKLDVPVHMDTYMLPGLREYSFSIQNRCFRS